MTTQTQAEDRTIVVKTTKRAISGEVVLGYAVLGCLVAGTIGVFKAFGTDGSDAAWCLLASVAAFGAVAYIYLQKS
jgi:hypothetical protein